MALKKIRKLATGAKPTVKSKIVKPARAPAPDRSTRAKASEGGAFAAAGAEKKRLEMERNKPFGLSIPVGGSATVYLLDKGEPWYHYEHTVGASKQSRGRTLPCIKDSGEMCPLCNTAAAGNKEGVYVAYLTCIVPVDRYRKKGASQDTVRAYQKKLFPIKVKMSETFRRLFERHGTFRGMVIKCHRDGEFDPATGNNIEYIKMLPEKQIQAYARGEGIKNLSRESREYIEKAKIADTFDYDAIFPKTTAAELAKMVGMSASSVSGSEDFGDDDDDFGSDADWG